MNTHTLTDADAARTECTCNPCHGCPAVTRLNDVITGLNDAIETMVAALATATGSGDPKVTRLTYLGQVTP